MKKSAAKLARASAPAPKTKPAAPTPKAAAKPVAPAKKSAPPTRKPVAKTKAAAAPPAVKSGQPAPVITTITARIDIGFGNTLHLRGEGPGLSWDKGVPLHCADDDAWTLTLPETARPVVFKFLVNDLTWSAGPDYVAAPGAAIEITPIFEH